MLGITHFELFTAEEQELVTKFTNNIAALEQSIKSNEARIEEVIKGAIDRLASEGTK